MSTRALRRMEAAKAAAKTTEDDESCGDDNEEFSQSSVGNKFDFLLDGDDADEEDSTAKEGEKSHPAKPSSAKSKKKKKKLPKNSAKANKSEGDNDEMVLEQAIKEAEAMALAESAHNMVDQSVTQAASAAREVSLCEKFGLNIKDPMSLNSKYLNSAHEVRFRFGTQVAGTAGVNSRNNRRRLIQSRLITPRPNWPMVGRTGLSMKPVDQEHASNTGMPLFTFEHDNAYAAAQQEFWIAVETMNPDAIAAVHRKHPYHIDTLLQLAELCLTADDPQSAADLVERAIFAMETSLHHNFILTRVGSRALDFRYFESRAFFLALFRHVMLLGRKGCTRTAFELSKLLLSLDFRRDPMCSLLVIDFYALRAGCNAELVAIYDELNRTKSLDWLPNFAYSVPLACFKLATLQNNSSGMSMLSKPHIPTSSGDSILAVAKSLMFNAFSRFPSVLIPLLEACSVKPDGKLVSCKWFPASLSEVKDEPKPLRALQSLYIERSSTVWKDMETLQWLESVVAEFVNTLDEEETNRRILRKLASTAFQKPCGPNVLRHLILANHREAIGFVSSELPFSAAIFSYDPLPPSDAIWTYTKTNPRRRRGASSQSSNPLDMFASFFASMLPNYNPNEQNQMQLRFDNFVQAFRNVLAGLNLEPPPFDPVNQNLGNANQAQQERFDLADLTDSENEAGDDPRRADNDELD